jgi:hypothetical protein
VGPTLSLVISAGEKLGVKLATYMNLARRLRISGPRPVTLLPLRAFITCKRNLPLPLPLPLPQSCIRFGGLRAVTFGTVES